MLTFWDKTENAYFLSHQLFVWLALQNFEHSIQLLTICAHIYLNVPSGVKMCRNVCILKYVSGQATLLDKSVFLSDLHIRLRELK